MGFQSGINAMLGSIAGAAFGIKQTLTQKQDNANKKVTEKQTAQKKQRRNFMNYLKSQPTSIGGTVGDLPTNVQKLIASGYSKSERKKLMDTMDKEMKR